MNEAERCDRISLMHRGQVLAVGRHTLRDNKQADSLETAFHCLPGSSRQHRGGGTPGQYRVGRQPSQPQDDKGHDPAHRR